MDFCCYKLLNPEHWMQLYFWHLLTRVTVTWKSAGDLNLQMSVRSFNLMSSNSIVWGKLRKEGSLDGCNLEQCLLWNTIIFLCMECLGVNININSYMFLEMEVWKAKSPICLHYVMSSNCGMHLLDELLGLNWVINKLRMWKGMRENSLHIMKDCQVAFPSFAKFLSSILHESSQCI